jgi:small subunit ribosomal protein S17
MNGEVRDIGIDVKTPANVCDDKHCPFHGNLPVRGQVIDGVVVSTKMDRAAVVERNYLKYDQKYERYEKRTSRYSVHNPPCLEIKVGDEVRIDLQLGTIDILGSDQRVTFDPMPDFLMSILQSGGLVPFTRERLHQK